jgi:hypothetical protein
MNIREHIAIYQGISSVNSCKLGEVTIIPLFWCYSCDKRPAYSSDGRGFPPLIKRGPVRLYYTNCI